MKPHCLLALAASLSFVATGARAQCDHEWLPGHGYAGVAGRIHRLALRDPDGGGPLPPRVLAAGSITMAGQVDGPIVEWDRATGEWLRLPGALGGVVRDVLVAANGEIFAAGSLQLANYRDVQAAARWDGLHWQPLGWMIGDGYAVEKLPSGEVVVGGHFTAFDNAGNWIGFDIACWRPGAGVMGFGFFDGRVTELALSDRQLFARGDFESAGGAIVNGFARWDGTAWSAMPQGVPFGWDYEVDTFAPLPNGDLVALFPVGAPGGPGSEVAIWNGANWTPLPASGIAPEHVCALGSGDVLVSSGDRVRRWDGTAWSDLVLPIVLGVTLPRPMIEDTNGDLLLAIGATEAAVGIARWDGTALSSLGSGIAGHSLLASSDATALFQAFARMPNGDLVAAGSFTRIGGTIARRVARWNGTAWSPMGSGLDGTVRALATLPNGDVVAAGSFTIGASPTVETIARWDGVAWTAMPWPYGGSIRALCVLPDGDLVAGGEFLPSTPGAARAIARWDGSAWSPLGNGINGVVHALAASPDGDLFVGGQFVEVGSPTPFPGGGVLALRIARWDGSAWSGLGAPVPSDNGVGGTVHAITVTAAGDVVVAGVFQSAGGRPARGVARWDGSSWHAMQHGLDQVTRTLLALPDGDVLAGTGGGLRRWDGVRWQTLSAPADIFALALHGSELFIGGNLEIADGSIGLARLATTCPATVAQGAPGCHGAALAAVELPWVESTLRTMATGLPMPSFALAATGFDTVVPGVPLASLLPQGLAGCEVHVAPDVLQMVATTASSAMVELFLPDSPPLVGLTFHQQLFAFETGAGTIVSVVATNALKFEAGRF